MPSDLLCATVGQLVAQQPRRAAVFERFGIDYCCGGRIPLEQACREKGVPCEQVIAELEAADRVPAPDARDWTHATMSELVDHIVRAHHDYLRRELPRLTALTDKVAAAHGERDGRLRKLRDVFRPFRAELETHMLKEEQILFPMCRRLETSREAPQFHCGSVSNPIAVMFREHDDAGAALLEMYTLTDGYVPPADACNTYRAMLSALQELERDMHQHVHLENNILFPRAIEAEQRLQAARAGAGAAGG